jgi:hypothetical protein
MRHFVDLSVQCGRNYDSGGNFGAHGGRGGGWQGAALSCNTSTSIGLHRTRIIASGTIEVAISVLVGSH